MKKLFSLILSLLLASVFVLPAMAYTAGVYTGEGQGKKRRSGGCYRKDSGKKDRGVL